jgi:gas vesicle protein
MSRITGFCIGLGAGAVAGLLWAPRKGEDTRTLIQNQAEHGKRYVRRRSHQLQRDVSRLKQRGVRLMNGQGEAVRAAIDAGKRAYQRVVG